MTWFRSGGWSPLWDRRGILSWCFRAGRCGTSSLLVDVGDVLNICHFLADITLNFWLTHFTRLTWTCFFTHRVHWLSYKAQSKQQRHCFEFVQIYVNTFFFFFWTKSSRVSPACCPSGNSPLEMKLFIFFRIFLWDLDGWNFSAWHLDKEQR